MNYDQWLNKESDYIRFSEGPEPEPECSDLQESIDMEAYCDAQERGGEKGKEG